MPDLEQRIRDTLDGLGERPDPARILERVGKRKRHLRVVRRVQTVALVAAVLAGVGGGTYALSRAFGIGHSRPVPIGPPRITPSPGGTSTPGVVPCSGQAARLTVVPQGGAAGTIGTLWKVTNTATTPCRSFGYPGMGFHTPSGWLDVQVHRGGFPNIEQPPSAIVVGPGRSQYFVSYWSDVPTGSASCRQFDRVRVTLPGDEVPAEVASSGCLNPRSVDVGPLTGTPPP